MIQNEQREETGERKTTERLQEKRRFAGSQGKHHTIHTIESGLGITNLNPDHNLGVQLQRPFFEQRD